MAITINQKPEDVEFHNKMLIYRCSSTNTAQPNFRYVVKVSVGGAQVYSGYITPNINGRLVFDLFSIADKYISADVAIYGSSDAAIHSLPNGVAFAAFSRSENACKLFTVDIEEGWDIAGVFTEAGATGAATHDIYLVNGSQEISYGFSGNRLQDDRLYPHVGSDHGWLTDRQVDQWLPDNQYLGSGSSIYIPCYEDDWGVVTFYHDAATTIANGDSLEISYSLYEEDGTQIGTTETKTINAANGAAAPNSTNEEDKVIHLGVFPENISAVLSGWTQHPDSGNPDWKYYTMRIKSSGGTWSSAFLIFVKQCDERMKSRIAWQGQSGGWEYFNFTKKKEKSTQARKKTIKKTVGSWQAASFNYEKFDRGETEFSRTTEQFLDVESDWLQEGEFTYLESLFRSKEVMLVDDDGGQLPLILESSSHIEKAEKGINLYNVSLKFKYAQPRR